MIDHMGFRVADLARSRRFYGACVRALGLRLIENTPESFLIARSAGKPLSFVFPFIWIGTANPSFWTSRHSVSASPIHLAFTAASRDAVDEFHKAAIEAGGADNGAPGPRGPEEMAYYAAFVLDPDGNNIEAGFRE